MSEQGRAVTDGFRSAPDTSIQKKCIHAILIEKNDGFGEIWLPTSIEGKYFFPIATENIFIIAENNKWKACISDGYFLLADPANPGTRIKTSETILYSNALYIAHIGESTYSLYIEDGSDSNKVFHPFFIERNKDIYIGREATCDIQYVNRLVSREHAILRYVGNQFTIQNNNSKNGIYVNGHMVQYAELNLGDVIHILGLCIVVGSGYIAMNSADKCRITSRRVIPLDEHTDLTYLAPSGVKTDFYDRKPRKKYRFDEKVIEIELPPPPLPKTKIPLALRLGSNALMGGQAIFTGNYIGAATSLFLPALTQGLTEKDRKEYEVKRAERYREYLKFIKNEIETEINFEEHFLNDVFPGLEDTLRFIDNRDRLWERRKTDDDFLTVRLGSGTIPMVAEKRYPQKRFEMEPDYLQQEMYTLVEKPSLLHNIPITVSLQNTWILGILGPQLQSLKMVVNMISYIAITHAYDDVKMVVLAPETMKAELAFTKYLQHFWDNERTIRFVATNSSDVQIISKYFRDKETQENEAKRKNFGKETSKQPACIVFALDKNLFEQSEVFKELLHADKYRGFSFVPAFENVPKESMKLIDLHGENLFIDLNGPATTDIGLLLDAVDTECIKKSMRDLSKVSLLMDSDKTFSLPSMITFLEMYGVGKVEHLNPLSRWEQNNPVKSLAVPIGIGTDGKLFTLNLHEKYQGPHGLVAGMTGSGKSEFIITYILSLAVNFSPDEVAFVLIDYKGGGLADAFVDPKRGIHLPHVIATITNLDGAAIQRSLTSIHSELSRRQMLFKKAKSETGEGTMDIYDYQRLYRSKRVSEPVPHLFIISDEFAELKKQQPEFMDSLISAARIGRSLGVHLILATQKPGGVVNDQIWSNTKFRACLKVQDRGDSMEMLKRPEAAELKHTGRFYLQVGYNEFFALGQSAWCGASYSPQDEIVKEKDNSVEFVDNAGQVILKAKKNKEKTKAESKQIVAIVKYLSDLAKRENIVPKSLWCEPLPAKLEYNILAEKSANDASENTLSALMGLVDDPEHQRQMPLLLDLMSFHHMALCGQAGSGKSTFFRTMLYSLVMKYPPEDVSFYILDLSGGALSAFRNVPHCGAYLTKENEADFDRMLAMIQEIVDERKKLFAEAEVFSYDDYVKIRKLPVIMVIMDGWTNISDFTKGQILSLSISKNMREATNYGIRFIFSANHLGEFSAKVSNELDYKIALKAKDKFDYNDILHVRNSFVPPDILGRGLCAIDGKALEYQVAMPNCNQDAQNQALLLRETLKARAQQLQHCKAARRLPVMDDKLEYTSFCNSFAHDRIPLGFSMQNMKEIAMPLQQMHTMGLYFGNPIGIKPVISNILSAFHREKGDVIVVRRNSGTIFDRNGVEALQSMFADHCSILDTTPESVPKLFNLLIGEYIPKFRIPYRNEYCELHGIPETDKGRTLKAAKYIRSKTTPLLILFESFADLVTSDKQAMFAEVFGKLKGFNIYFAGCFYPEDENLSVNSIFRSFNKEDFSLFFGGQFHKQWITSMPSEYRKMEKINPNYNRFIMKYRSEYHQMVMPCGELMEANVDPDEQEII